MLSSVMGASAAWTAVVSKSVARVAGRKSWLSQQLCMHASMPAHPCIGEDLGEGEGVGPAVLPGLPLGQADNIVLLAKDARAAPAVISHRE